MKAINLLKLFAIAQGLLFAPAAFAGLIVSAPVDVIGNLSLAQFNGNGYGTNAYKDWGNEPFVAVNPLNTNNVFVSSFSFNTNSTAVGANVFYSTNGGASWTSQFSVPAASNGVRIPNDWTFAYNSAGVLHGTVLGGGNIFQGATPDPTSLAAWTYTGAGTPINTALSATRADQPWIAVQGANVFVAYDDFHSNTAERVVASSNNGTTFPVDNPINNGAQANSVNPGTRIATDGAGRVYSIFGVGSATATPGVHNVTYYLNRSSNGGVTWDFNASSVVGGIIIDSGVSTQLCNSIANGGTCTQAANNWFANVNDLRGNITAIAPDKTGSHVYVLIGKRDGTGTDRMFLAAYQSVGVNLVKLSEIVISPTGQRAALPAITVKDDGTVVMMYETFGADGKVHVHLASSDDFGASIASDTELYSFTPPALSAVVPGACDTVGCPNREFGDYDFLMSVGDTFFGVFAGLGDVNAGGIDTTALIVPFFFSGIDAVPQPGSLSLVLTGLAAAAWLRRRKNKR